MGTASINFGRLDRLKRLVLRTGLCGASMEFFSHEVTKIEEEIGHKYRFDATRHNFQIYSVCEDCRRK